MSLAGNGSLLLAAALGSARGEAPHWAGGSLVPVMMWGATGWMAGTAVLFLGGGMGPGQLARWRSLPRGAPSIIGALSLLGVPATSGFVVGSAVMRDLTMTGNRVWGLGFLIGQGLLVAALARWLLAPKPVCREDRPLLFQIVHVIALVILGVALILLGVVPGRVLPVGDNGVAPGLTALLAGPGLAGWLLWGGALLVGFILRIADARARPIISLWLDGLHEFARLEWVYDLLVGAAEQGSAAFRAADSVLTGRAALLWSSIALLLAVLLLRS